MGDRGPLPKPYARRRRGRPTSAHAVLVARPKMPVDLSPEAKAEWRRVVPQLEGMGVLATLDRALLIRYVTAWADWVELEGMLQKSGKLIRGQKGNFVRNPIWLLRRDADETVTELARQLGLSPVARLRAGVVHERPPDREKEDAGIAAIAEYRRRLQLDDDPRDILRSTP